jgi:hypothetical protein
MRLRRWDREIRSAMKGRPNFTMRFSSSQTAASLWDYGEDDLAERALRMSETDLVHVQRIAAVFESPTYPLPIEGQRITHNHVTAMAALAYFEGRLRPLARTRRRPGKDRPQRYAPTPVRPVIAAAPGPEPGRPA